MMKGETMYSTQKQGRVAIDRRSLLGASAALAVGGMLGLAGCSSSPKTDTPAAQPVTVTGFPTSPFAALAATPMDRTARPPDTTEDVS